MDIEPSELPPSSDVDATPVPGLSIHDVCVRAACPTLIPPHFLKQVGVAGQGNDTEHAVQADTASPCDRRDQSSRDSADDIDTMPPHTVQAVWLDFSRQIPSKM